MQFHRPDTVEDALHLIARHPARLLAGGTDFYPALSGRTTPEPVVDLSGIASLSGISRNGAFWRIGAMTRWSQIRDAELPAKFLGLQLAAREVGSVQIQNAGTIAGNLCNASPAADGVPPLLALDAEVEIAGPDGTRLLPLSSFITGVRRTDLRPGEIVTAILVPDAPESQSAFLKLGARRYLVISIAMVAANVVLSSGGALEGVAIAIGACSAVAQRLTDLEAALKGTVPGSDAFLAAIAEYGLHELTPIDDVRASAGYRLDAVRTLIARAVIQASGGRG
jgi:CO/xanthine dehydrogenase FAD-binding subunit